MLDDPHQGISVTKGTKVEWSFLGLDGHSPSTRQPVADPALGMDTNQVIKVNEIVLSANGSVSNLYSMARYRNSMRSPAPRPGEYQQSGWAKYDECEYRPVAPNKLE